MLRDPDLEPGTTPASHGRTSLPLHWPTSVASAIGSVLGHTTNAGNTLPRPNRVGVPINPQDRDQREGRRRKRDLLFLLYCVPAGEGGCGTLLRQDLVPAVKTDREFFTFLRDVYYSSRRLSSRLSLRTVSAIGNCRVTLSPVLRSCMDFANLVLEQTDRGRFQQVRIDSQAHHLLS